MINCGGALDLSELFFNERESVNCYIIDNHRPYNHVNVHSKSVIIFHDGCKSFDICPTPEDCKLFDQLEDLDGDDDDSADFSDEEEA